MASNYDQIRANNIREYGEGTRHLNFLGRLYTDRTHFIFELLQNAEDAGANKVLFELFEDRLEVRHDGCPFNERDVIGICGVGEGSKTDDYTKIGKFGIGFKSVYAYTTMPEIHSGDEHFRIEHYVRPHAIAAMIPELPWTTLFIFAFNAPGCAGNTAWGEIAKRLHSLSARTLLFLRNIKEIEYKLPDKSGGIYLFEEISRGHARQVTVIGQNTGLEEYESWLVFHRPVYLPDGGSSQVELAWKTESTIGDTPERITKVENSPLIVYFPTEKETPLGFLLQGPYRTTPARDNVPFVDEWNRYLLEESAKLLIDSLAHLKEMGLLSASALETLPIRSKDLIEPNNMFYCLARAVKKELACRDLLPADDGTFVSGKNARLARTVNLRELLSNNHLQQLFQTEQELKWLSGEITQDRTPELRRFLMNELKITEMDPEAFARNLSEPFLIAQDDEWFARFFVFLADQNALWRASKSSWQQPGMLRSKPILRLEDGSLVVPFDDSGHPRAYLPGAANTDLACVRRSIVAQPMALEFLKQLGLTEPDVVADVIERILPKYTNDGFAQISDEQYLLDLHSIKDAYGTDSKINRDRLIAASRKAPLVKAINAASGQYTFKTPGDTWLPTADVKLLFAGNPVCWFVHDSIPQDFHDVLVSIGVRKQITPQYRASSYDGVVSLQHQHGWHVRGLQGFDPYATIEGVDFALQNPNIERACFIWNRLLVPNIPLLEGDVEKATRQDYTNGKVERQRSNLGNLVVQHAWIPTKALEFKNAAEVSIDDLHSSLQHDEQLFKVLGIKLRYSPSTGKTDSSQEHHARALGLEVNDLENIEFYKQNRVEFAEWKEQREARMLSLDNDRKPEFPVRVSSNPERREHRLSEQIAESSEKKFDLRNRSVRTSRFEIDPTAWLRSHYTNDDQQIICQICKEEMPFRKRDGDFYFEAVEMFTADISDRELEAQFLALCPLCAAMYTEFVKRDESAMENLVETLMRSEQPEIPVQLGELHATIRFVSTHFADIKVIVRNDSMVHISLREEQK